MLIKLLQLTIYRIVDFHPNILKFYGVTKGTISCNMYYYIVDYSSIFNEFIVDDRNTYILVLEWANGGSLRNYLKLNFLSMTGNDKLRFAKEITRGIMCLHKKGIIHRDLVIYTIGSNEHIS